MRKSNIKLLGYNICFECFRLNSVQSRHQHLCESNVCVTKHDESELRKTSGHSNCFACPGKFVNFRQFQLHINFKHKLSVTYWCELCGMSFYSRANLDTHNHNFHTEDLVSRLLMDKRNQAEEINKKIT